MNWKSEWKNDDVWTWPNPRKVTLLIPIQNAKVEIEAWQVGDLAVHKFIDETGGLDDDCYQITHVPTLTRFDKAVPWDTTLDWNIAKQALLSWCHKVQLEHQDLWAQLRAFRPDNYKSIDADLLIRIRDWCLSVSI